LNILPASGRCLIIRRRDEIYKI
jgi:hypothetical protein